jgi:fumarate hydratase class I
MSECILPQLTSPKVVEDRSLLPRDWTLSFTEPSLPGFQLAVLELIRRTSSRLPQDVIDALVRGRDAEAPGSRAFNTLNDMVKNILLADGHVTPLCQDTGTVIFYVKHPTGLSQRTLKKQIRQAVVQGTERVWLRPNCVESLSGKNTGTNLDPFGEGHPVIHFEEWDRPELEVGLMLKGGGCENVGAQYRLPDVHLGAGRDLSGVRKCIIDAVMKAQGQGCSPGILGVAIGGDRVTGYEHSKALLMRTLGAPHPKSNLMQLESDLTRDLNTLGIGPMGYGGKTTVLGLFIDELYRHPASFFVSVSYMCWSSRRRILTLDATGRPHFN